MNSFRKSAMIVGVLFLTSTATMMLGSDELIGSILGDPDYLVNFSVNENQVIIGVLLELYCAVAVAGIAILMYPILKKQNEALSLGYVGFRIIEAVLIIFISISALSLLTLSREFVMAGAPDASYYQTFGTLLISASDWAFVMVWIVVGISGLMFCYLLYQSKLVPRVMSVLGLIGYALLLAIGLLDMFSLIDMLHGAEMILFLPGALFEIILPIWLIVKGFNPSAIASE
jgi:hypothetical protein